MIQRTWSLLIAPLMQIPRRARSIRVLVPLALTLTLILGAAALLGNIGQQRANTHTVGASSLLVARADFHAETQFRGKDLELNLAISQTGDDCSAALNGGVCLRYSVVLDEKPIMVGYGVIPITDVRVTASSIGIKVDTSKVPNFVQTVGAGGPISINWKIASPAAGIASAQINRPQKATAQGGIASYALPSSGVIATIIYR